MLPASVILLGFVASHSCTSGNSIEHYSTPDIELNKLETSRYQPRRGKYEWPLVQPTV
jgi:hypothetical protein